MTKQLLQTVFGLTLSLCLAGFLPAAVLAQDPDFDEKAIQVEKAAPGSLEADYIAAAELEASVAADSRNAQPRVGFPASSCRLGYHSAGPRLCITPLRGPTTFTNAEIDCRDIRGRVATYSDLRYLRFRDSLSHFNQHLPRGRWLGNGWTDDNQSLFGNSNNIADFDGVTSRFDNRSYFCTHDRT